MKRIPLLFALGIVCLSASSRNTPPAISNISALADTIIHRILIFYDLSDAEGDPADILLDVSSDGGSYFTLPTDNATGDIGFNITPGTGKRISWNYPDTLTSQITSCIIKLGAATHGVDLATLIAQVDSNRLKQNLQFITGIRHRSTGIPHLQAVRDSIYMRFMRYGMQARHHLFPLSAYQGQNIIGRKAGSYNYEKTFILDGHYDTVANSPGADDNGSGIAGVLEAVRVLSPYSFAYSIDFIGFDLEEAGLAGSTAFVANGIETPDENIAGVINIDMISYSTEEPFTQTLPAGFEILFPELYQRLVDNDFRGNFIISTADANSRSLLTRYESVATEFVSGLLVGSVALPEGIDIPDARRSDHGPFWDAGYRALHLSDGAETRNPNYHKPGDVLSTINIAFMQQVAQAAIGTLASLAMPVSDIRSVTAPVTYDPHPAVHEALSDDCAISIIPASGSLAIRTAHCGSQPMTLRIIAIDGTTVGSYHILPEGADTLRFDSPLAPGYYLLQWSTAKKSYSKKIFIQ